MVEIANSKVGGMKVLTMQYIGEASDEMLTRFAGTAITVKELESGNPQILVGTYDGVVTLYNSDYVICAPGSKNTPCIIKTPSGEHNLLSSEIFVLTEDEFDEFFEIAKEKATNG